VIGARKGVQSFLRTELDEGHIAVVPAFASALAVGLSAAWKPKVEVGGMGMDDLDLDLVGRHSCRPEDMVVEAVEQSKDHDIPELVVLGNEEAK
jgi:hypothetical protein